MGTWDSGSFDNDTAADWAHELESPDDLSHIEATIDAALAFSPPAAVPVDVGERAIAAAATLARSEAGDPRRRPMPGRSMYGYMHTRSTHPTH